MPSETDMIITLASVVAQVQQDHFLNNICAEEIKTPAGDIIQDRWNSTMSDQDVLGDPQQVNRCNQVIPQRSRCYRHGAQDGRQHNFC